MALPFSLNRLVFSIHLCIINKKEDRYLETHKTWNNIAQLYEDKFMKFELYNDAYKSFCDLLLRSGASVLEIGCGPGNITRHILDLNPKLNAIRNIK